MAAAYTVAAVVAAVLFTRKILIAMGIVNRRKKHGSLDGHLLASLHARVDEHGTRLDAHGRQISTIETAAGHLRDSVALDLKQIKDRLQANHDETGRALTHVKGLEQTLATATAKAREL